MEAEARMTDRQNFAGSELSRSAKEGRAKSMLNLSVAKLEAQRARCMGFLDRIRAIEVSKIQDDLEEQFAALLSQSEKECFQPAISKNKENRSVASENVNHGLSDYDKAIFDIACEDLKTELGPQEFAKLDTNVMNAKWLFAKNEKKNVVATANVLQQAIKDVLPDEEETDTESDTETHYEQFMHKVVPKNKVRRYKKVESTAISKWAKYRSRHMAVSSWLDHAISDTWFRYRQQDALYKQMRITKPVFEFETPEASSSPSFISIPLTDVEGVQCYNNPMETASVNLRLTNSNKPSERRSSTESSSEKRSSTPSPRAKTPVKMSKTLYKGVDRSESLELLADAAAAINESESIRRKITPVASPIKSSRQFIQISSNDDTSSRAARCRPIKQCKSRKVFKIHGIKHFLEEEIEPPKINYCHCKTNDACFICLGEKHSEAPKVPTGLKERLTSMENHFHKAFVIPEESSLETICHKYLEEIDDMNYVDLDYQDGRLFKSTGDNEPQVRRFPVERIVPVMPSEVMKRGRGRPRVRPYGVNASGKSDQGLKKNKYRRRKTFGVTRKRRQTDREDTGDEEFDDYRMHGYGLIKRSYSSRRKQDFDIDNIVIPSHVSANTRVEKLEYKEIIIPSFRLIEYQPTYNGDEESPSCSKRPGVKRGKRFLKKIDNDYEDLDDELIKARHERCLEEEKRKFNTVYRANLNRRRRTDSTTDPQQNPDSGYFKGENKLSISMEVTNEPSPPHSSTPVADNYFDDQPVDMNQPILSSEDASLAASAIKIGQSRRRTVSSSKTDEFMEEILIAPFSEREFPLTKEEYVQMESEMPDPDSEDILL